MIYLTNAFSLQMLQSLDSKIVTKEVSAYRVSGMLKLGFISGVGHQDTSNILSNMLGIEVAFNRLNVSLLKGDTLVVAQVVGGRLPEGATSLPVGVQIKFIKVKLV